MADYAKVKSVAKVVVPRSEALERKILDTMRQVSDIVGATLGPGGSPVLIERQEFGLPALVTKDGVTVAKSLGFNDPISHSIMESARDAAIRTVGEAGDGTTTATVLSEAIVRYTAEYIRANPRTSKQRVVQTLEKIFANDIEPLIKKLSIPADLTKKKGRTLLRSVAKISANGDEELAEAVMNCYDLVGDTGSITITEQSGPSTYEVERISGYPVPVGFEESCAKFMGMFVNDAANNRVYVEKPLVILYHGVLTEVQTMYNLLMRLQNAWRNHAGNREYDENAPTIDSPNVVIAAVGFSEAVLGTLALNMVNPESINIIPLLCPKSPILNSELHFLQDLAAVTAGEVLDPVSRPMDSVSANFEELGYCDSFEMLRFRSTLIGHADPDEVAFYAEGLEKQIENAESELDRRLLQERLGKVTGGIAKLRVVGASNGELKEKRDRAEDAVMAVRGAIKHGCLPGGGWTLLAVAAALLQAKEEGVKGEVVEKILAPALREPVYKLYANAGLDAEQAEHLVSSMIQGKVAPDMLRKGGNVWVYDVLNNTTVDAIQEGVLDSTPAVLEAVRNSISIASLLGTLGGVVVFERDKELERREASANQDFVRNANVNEANLRP